MDSIYKIVIVGLLGGVLGGMFGIGGGIIMIPLLMFWMGYSQVQAQGITVAAFLIPVGFLASAWKYYQEGQVDVRASVIVAFAMFVGGYFGSKVAFQLPIHILSKAFGVFLIIIGIRFLAKS